MVDGVHLLREEVKNAKEREKKAFIAGLDVGYWKGRGAEQVNDEEAWQEYRRQSNEPDKPPVCKCCGRGSPVTPDGLCMACGA